MAERWPRDGRSALPPATSPDEPSRAEPSPPPQDILLQAVPGNLRRADSFVLFLKRLVAHLKKRLQTEEVVQETPLAFLSQLLHEEESFLDTSQTLPRHFLETSSRSCCTRRRARASRSRPRRRLPLGAPPGCSARVGHRAKAAQVRRRAAALAAAHAAGGGRRGHSVVVFAPRRTSSEHSLCR